MKEIITGIFIISILLSFQAQEIKHQSVMLHIGKPYVQGAWALEHNSLIELGFKNVFSKDFAYSIFLNRTYSDGTKSFFNDNAQLINYLNETNQGLFNWDKVETYALGIKGHFFFINKPKAEFSFFTGFGAYLSASELQSASEVSFNSISEVISVVQDFEKDTVMRPFFMPGLAFRYWVWKNIALGINAISFFEIHGSEFKSVPLSSNFYSLAFNISYKL